MSNSVGKAREHEKWQRLRDDNQNRAKVTIKRESDEELSRRLLALVKRDPVVTADSGRRILSHVPMVNREKKETDVPKC